MGRHKGIERTRSGYRGTRRGHGVTRRGHGGDTGRTSAMKVTERLWLCRRWKSRTTRRNSRSQLSTHSRRGSPGWKLLSE